MAYREGLLWVGREDLEHVDELKEAPCATLSVPLASRFRPLRAPGQPWRSFEPDRQRFAAGYARPKENRARGERTSRGIALGLDENEAM